MFHNNLIAMFPKNRGYHHYWEWVHKGIGMLIFSPFLERQRHQLMASCNSLIQMVYSLFTWFWPWYKVYGLLGLIIVYYIWVYLVPIMESLLWFINVIVFFSAKHPIYYIQKGQWVVLGSTMTRYFHQVFSMLCAMGHAHLDHNDLVTNVSPIPSSINVVRFSSRAPITLYIYKDRFLFCLCTP